jgi:hypothetical protein
MEVETELFSPASAAFVLGASKASAETAGSQTIF